MTVTNEVRIAIHSDTDIVTARQQGRAIASRAGFDEIDLTVISTAISEVARNIVEYAYSGEILVKLETNGSRSAIVVIARDEGPGIQDISRAMQDGYSTGRGLGLGLPGTRRLMDEFEISSQPGVGTVITMRKWRS